MVKKINRSKYPKLPLVLSLVAVLLIAGGVYAYHVNHKPKPIPTLNQYTKGQTNQSNTPSDTSNQSGAPSNPKTTGGGTSLAAPTGNFVSNHHPNLSGSPAPNSMTSVCNTSPGTSCLISFTNGGITKYLPAQVTDAGGATFWTWKLQDIGLTAGSWNVSATSSLDGKTQSSTDPMALVVSQ